MPAGLDSSGARRLGGGLLSDLWRLANPCRDPGTRRPATASLRTLRRRLANGAVALSLLRRARSRKSRLAGAGCHHARAWLLPAGPERTTGGGHRQAVAAADAP